ncbi:MAG: FAD-dependent oxidoreductase [Saprospiraceae bacterium]
MHIGIVGGGLSGLFSAYYLLEKGHQITIFDDIKEVDSASYGNAGMICPSHFIPLAAPGIIMQGMKWMFDKQSPLLFRPTPNLDFIKWCYTFYRNSNSNNVAENMGLLSGLLNWSKELYLELEKKHILPPVQQKGIVMYCNTQHALNEEIHLVKTAQALHICTNILSNKDLEILNPGIEFNGIGGVHYTGDMHIEPYHLMNKLKKYLLQHQVDFIQEEVNNFEITNRSVEYIITSSGRKKIDALVIGAGVMTPHLTKKLNYQVLIQGGKGYNITLPKASPQLTTPLILVEGRVALTPMNTNLRIGGTMELGKLNSSISQNRINGILRSTEAYLPDYKANQLRELKPWYGYRPLSVNGLPIIEKIPHLQNVFINSGHGMLGLSLAPACGIMIEQIISNTLALA